MNGHPVSFMGGQTSFFMAFHIILRQISNYCFCAISSREFSVNAIFYAFYNYEADLFQAVSWMFSIKCHLYGVSVPASSWCLVLITNKQTATHSCSGVDEVERPKTEGKCKRALVMVISIYPCGINTHRKELIKSLDTMNVYEILAHYKSSDIDFIPDILIPQSKELH